MKLKDKTYMLVAERSKLRSCHLAKFYTVVTYRTTVGAV